MTNQIHTKAVWLGNEHIDFELTNDFNHRIVCDSQQELGPKPMEMILMGLSGCTSYDVVSILQKSRQAINHVECHVQAERADTVPAIFTKIHLTSGGYFDK